MVQGKASFFQANGVLLLVVGILAGFIGGYAFSRAGAPAQPVTPLTLNTGGAVNCPHTLDPGDQEIIAGLQCPDPACTQQVGVCHCDRCHAIEDRVKVLLGDGVARDQIRQQIVSEFNL
jgi:hypothetical protein